MNLVDWLVRLETLHPSEIELGLDRVAAVAGRLELLPACCPVVTVAGTNGKGSTITVLDKLLLQAGYYTGRFTSPHLLRYNERVCLGGEPVSDQLLIDAFEIIEAARGGTALTYFEYGTLAALLIFREAGVSHMLLEVGLGGRLDAVNILDPDLAVITSIALDHESWLGDNREQIALEKAGILRSEGKLICVDPMPPQSLLDRADELSCTTWLVGRDFSCKEETFPLRQENVAGAIQAAKLLGVDVPPTTDWLATVNLPGRQQWVDIDGISVCLDVAHNPAAVANCAEAFASRAADGRRVAVFAALSDKNIHAMIRSCQDLVDAWFVADLPGVSRAAAVGELASVLREQGVAMVSESKNPRQAYRRAMSLLQPGDNLLVFGSFHTVAEILPVVIRERSKV